MGDVPINALDIVVVLVVLALGLFAFLRGFVHELLSVTSWVGASLAAVYGLPLARPYVARHIEVDWIADAATAGGIFLVSLVLLSLITHAVSRRVRDSALNGLDRSLGFVFGLAKGAVLVSLAYMLAVWIMKPADDPVWRSRDQPDWLIEARSRPLMEYGAGLIQKALPAEYGLARGRAEAAAEEVRRLREAERSFRDLARPQPRAAPGSAEPGYGTSERRDLERLIQSNP